MRRKESSTHHAENDYRSDAPILRDLKRRQKQEGKSLGRVVSDLLAQALHQSKVQANSTSFRWIARSMQAQIDLSDKDAVYRYSTGSTGDAP